MLITGSWWGGGLVGDIGEPWLAGGEEILTLEGLFGSWAKNGEKGPTSPTTKIQENPGAKMACLGLGANCREAMVAWSVRKKMIWGQFT